MIAPYIHPIDFVLHPYIFWCILVALKLLEIRDDKMKFKNHRMTTKTIRSFFFVTIQIIAFINKIVICRHHHNIYIGNLFSSK